LLERINFSLALAANRLSKGLTVDWLSQLAEPPLQPEEEERAIESLLLHGQVSEKTRNLISQQLGSISPPTTPPGSAKAVVMSQPLTPAQAHQAADREAALTAGLLFGSPDFQRR
jgi:hypothetical protein